MKKHRMPFTFWEDDHTALLRAERGDKWADDREYYVNEHIRSDPRWPHSYFLNKRCWKLMRDHGPFRRPYYDCEKLVDRHNDETAFVFCPGPTMPKIDLRSRGVVLAINSAAFAVQFEYWVMAESGYARWLIEQRHPVMKPIMATARVAVVLRDEDVRNRSNKFDPVYVLRWEEEKIVPCRTPAVSVMNALATVWQMGCKRVFILGLDLSKSGGPYVEGVPYTDIGAKNPFDDQIKALRQFSLPGLKVYNCSSLSKDTLPFEYVSHEAIQDAI